MASYKVVVEFRPRIRTFNFFVKTQVKPKSVVIVEPNLITIQSENGNDLTICVGNVKLVKESVSGLNFSNDVLYFHTKSEPNNSSSGYFRYEFVSVGKPITENSLEPYKPDIQPEQIVNIKCRKCFKTLCETFDIKRILPLPSSETNDFFCHKHNDVAINLNPRPGDCLYNNYYFKINIKNFHTCDDGVVTCPQCSYWLGIKQGESVTLWNSSVTFDDTNFDVTENIAKNDFISLIKFIINKDEGVTSKMILSTKISDDECYYLLIYVLDKNLCLLADDTFTTNRINLKEIRVAKILYTFEKEHSDIVKQWEQDYNVNEEKVSKQMITEGLSYLEEMSSIIPNNFRESKQMFVSYIQ